MKRRAHAKRRDLNEPGIVEALRRVGACVYLLDEPADLLVGWRGATYLIEIKRGELAPAARPLTEAEAEFFRAWRGGRAAVVRDLEEALCVVGARGCRAAPGCGCGSQDDPAWYREARAERARAMRDAARRVRRCAGRS